MTHTLLFDNCVGTILVLSLLLGAGFTALVSLGAFWAGATVNDVKREVLMFCWVSLVVSMFVSLFLFSWGAVLENRLIGSIQEEPTSVFLRILFWLISIGGLAFYVYAPFWGYRSERKRQNERKRTEERIQLANMVDRITEGARVEYESYPGTRLFVYLWTPDGHEHRVCSKDLMAFVQQHPDASASKPENT